MFLSICMIVVVELSVMHLLDTDEKCKVTQVGLDFSTQAVDVVYIYMYINIKILISYFSFASSWAGDSYHGQFN